MKSNRIGVLLTTGVLIVWAVLAARRPELTYHFAPLIAAFVWPASLRGSEPAPIEHAVRGGMGSAVLVSGATLVLLAAGRLEGPTFVSSDKAFVESLIFAALAAAFGVRVATRERGGLVGSLFSRD